MLTLNNINGQYVKFYFTTNTLLPILLKNTASIIILQEQINNTDTSYFRIDEENDGTKHIGMFANASNISNFDSNYQFVDSYDKAYVDLENSKKKYLTELDTYRLYYSVWVGGKKILGGYGMHQSTEKLIDTLLYEFINLKNKTDNIDTHFVSHEPWTYGNNMTYSIEDIIEGRANQKSEEDKYNISYTYFIPKKTVEGQKNSSKQKLYLVDFIENVKNIINAYVFKENLECTNIQYLVAYSDNDISTKENVIIRNAVSPESTIIVEELTTQSLIRKISMNFILHIPEKVSSLYCVTNNESTYIKYKINIFNRANTLISTSEITDKIIPSSINVGEYYLTIEDSVTFGDGNKVNESDKYYAELYLYKPDEHNIFNENEYDSVKLSEIIFKMDNQFDIYIQSLPTMNDNPEQNEGSQSMPLKKFNGTLSYFFTSDISFFQSNNITAAPHIIYFMVNKSLKINNVYISWLVYIESEEDNTLEYTTSEFVNVTNFCKLSPDIQISKSSTSYIYNIYSLTIYPSGNSSDKNIVSLPLSTGNALGQNIKFSIRIDVEPDILLDTYKENKGITSTCITSANMNMNDIVADSNGKQKLSTNNIYINNYVYDTMDWSSILGSDNPSYKEIMYSNSFR